MQKDFKIGLGVGLLFVVGVALWLSTQPELSTEARALQKAPNTPPYVSSSLPSPDSELRNTKSEIRTTNDDIPQRFHIVQKSETLSAIAAQYYGSSNQWPKIVAANRSTLPDPDKLIPGTRLIIPE